MPRRKQSVALQLATSLPWHGGLRALVDGVFRLSTAFKVTMRLETSLSLCLSRQIPSKISTFSPEHVRPTHHSIYLIIRYLIKPCIGRDHGNQLRNTGNNDLSSYQRRFSFHIRSMRCECGGRLCVCRAWREVLAPLSRLTMDYSRTLATLISRKSKTM